MKVYFINPADLDKLRKAVGTQGSTLNPVQDADGNWFISPEEVNSPEFVKFFNQDEVALKEGLVEMDYKRPAYDPADPTKFTTKSQTTETKEK